MKHSLCLDTLGQLHDGAAREAIDLAIRTAIADVDDRGDDGKARKVQIVIELKRHDNGTVATVVEAAAVLPKYRTAETFSKFHKRSDKHVGLLFDSLSPEDPDQMTTDDVEEERRQS
jgi:hypothetical protein